MYLFPFYGLNTEDNLMTRELKFIGNDNDNVKIKTIKINKNNEILKHVLNFCRK